MRTIPAAMQTKLDSADFVGDSRATTRVTVQKFLLRSQQYNGFRELVYASALFPTTYGPAAELPNLLSVRWERNIENEIGSATIEMMNARAPFPGEKNTTDSQEFDSKGYYTYNRGKVPQSASLWGHSINGWKDVLVPDRMVRIYQGYGADYDVPPSQDPNMLLMGVFLIDDVIYTADGYITIECRDVGRLLQDQIVFPPVVPLKRSVFWQVAYPMKFEPYRVDDLPDKSTTTVSGSTQWIKPRYGYSGEVPYVGFNGSVLGHHGTDCFDNNLNSYWLSTGNARPSAGYSFEYIQGKIDPNTLKGARIRVWGGPYTWYLSVRSNGVWQGAAVVPYDPNNPASAPNGSNIRYIRSGRIGKEGVIEVVGLDYPNVDAVRFTFTDLYNSGVGRFPYRAGAREMEVLAGTTTVTTTTIDGGNIRNGNYGDYSEIVKKLLAFGGFHWPPGATQELVTGTKVTYNFVEHDPYLMLEDGPHRLDRLLREVKAGRTFDDIRKSVDHQKYGDWTTHFEPLPTDPGQDAPFYPPPYGTATDAYATSRIQAIFDNRGIPVPQGPAGRVWGDIQMSGTASKTILDVEVWDKKPLLDCITYVKDVLGFLFWIDEQGAAQFRLPNQFSLGNWVSDVHGFNKTRQVTHVELVDDQDIIELSAKVSSRSIREHTFVAHTTGRIGAVARPKLPVTVNFRRVAGWTDQNFEQESEAQVMADLIAMRQGFTYRQNSLTIPADPRIQIDDQIKIKERTTGDNYYHYVRGIASSWDSESGKWTYDLTTNWLGTSPTTEWAVNRAEFSPATQTYLAALGAV